MDIGSGFCKAGLSYDDVPSVVFPTLLARPNDASAIPGVSKDAIFVGNDVMLRRGALTLSVRHSNMEYILKDKREIRGRENKLSCCETRR